MDRESIRKPLELSSAVLFATAIPVGILSEGSGEDNHGSAGQAKPPQGIRRTGPAFQRRADQVGAQPALHVGAGPHPQQVQRDELGGVLETPRSRSAVSSPSTAAQIEPSTSSPARTAIATRGMVNRLDLELLRV